MGAKLGLSPCGKTDWQCLRRVFEPKGEIVEKIAYEELHNICSLAHTNMIRWVEHEAHPGEVINVYKVIVGKHERKRVH